MIIEVVGTISYVRHSILCLAMQSLVGRLIVRIYSKRDRVRERERETQREHGWLSRSSRLCEVRAVHDIVCVFMKDHHGF